MQSSNNPVVSARLIEENKALKEHNNAQQKQILQLKETLSKSNLTAYYPFKNNATDATGHGNDGIVCGAHLTTDHFGKPNSAYYFDGKSYIKGSAKYFPTHERTVSLWFKPDIYPIDLERDRGGALFGYGGTGTGPSGTSWLMGLNNRAIPPNTYHFQSHWNLNSVGFQDPKLNGSPSAWTHLAVTTDNQHGTNMYVNGKIVNQPNHIFVDNTFVQGKEFAIGNIPNTNGIVGYTDGSLPPFRGAIDDVQVYDRALTQKDINELYLAKEKLDLTANKTGDVELTATSRENVKLQLKNQQLTEKEKDLLEQVDTLKNQLRTVKKSVIDEVKIYDRALSDTEVKQLLKTPKINSTQPNQTKNTVFNFFQAANNNTRQPSAILNEMLAHKGPST